MNIQGGEILKILVDADACPVVKIVEKVAKEVSAPVILLCDTNHILKSDYSEIKVIGAGVDAVDIALANLCQSGDIAVTQDYGVAALVLGKGGYAIHQSGRIFTNDNIDGLLMERHINKKARMASSKNHLKGPKKGPKKRTKEDDLRFESAFRRLLSEILSHDLK